MDLQIIAAVLTIIASVYGMLKFMLKDTHLRVEILEKKQDKFEIEMNEFKMEMRQVNNRLDGLYRVILDRTYGKNIPEDLK